jgi:hypothetical protein
MSLSRGGGQTSRFRARGAGYLASSAALALVVLTCLAQVASAQAASSSTSSTTSSSSVTAPSLKGDLAIDGLQFAQTIPSYAVLGDNYTVRVVVHSTATISVPVIIQISVPVEAIYVHPQILQADIQPMGTLVANFTIVPFAPPHTGPYNVTALLFVFFPDSMSSPQLVDQATATVTSMGPNQFPYLGVVLVGACVAALVLVVVFYRELTGRGSPPPEWEQGPGRSSVLRSA